MAGVRIADTLSRFGSGKYPLVIAADIDLSDGTNLQEYLDDLLLKIVQADWEQADTTAIDYIKNKPIIPVLTDLIDDETESDETTYSSNKIKALINAIEAGIKFEIVEELPSEDIDTHTIYLVPREEEENDNNGYDEYLYINDKWELIGSTYIDLSNYYTKSDVDGLLANKQDSLSQQQMFVLNSGITSEKVSTYDGYATTKVDKVQGKGLSTNDFTDEDKTKLDNAISTLPIASEVRLGTVKIGDNLVIDENGTLSAVNTGVTSYSPLSDKPSINNVELDGNKTLNDLGIDIPTATSDLINDSNFVSDSNYVHTDNNFTNTLKDKLNNIVANIIDDINSSLSTTYSSSKIDALINSIVGGMDIEIVQELPSSGEEHTIYLVPKQDASTGDVYNEYIYVDSEWELIGNTQIDLSDYYTKQEVDSALNGKVDKVSGKGLSTEDYSSAEKTKLGNIESGAEVNVINNIKLNGTSQTITNKEVDLRVQELPSGGATGQSLVKSSASDYDVEWANTENVQLSEMPTASVEYVDKIYQYVGETSQNYINGKYYKCVLVEEHLCWRYYQSGYAEVKVWTIGKPFPIVLYSDSACTSVRNYSSASYKSDSQMSIQFPGESWGRDYNRYSSSDYNVYAWQQVNVGANIKVNGIAQQFSNGSYDIPVPTKTSDLDNDSDYVTLDDFLIDNQVSENTTYSSSKIESLVGDFDNLTNRPLESEPIDIEDLDLPMPAKPTEYPILFDETGAEYKVGLYKRASDGKVKPIYRKYTSVDFEPTSMNYYAEYVDLNVGISNIEQIVNAIGLTGSSTYGTIPIGAGKLSTDGHITLRMLNVIWRYSGIIIEYTKTSDEWKEV